MLVVRDQTVSLSPHLVLCFALYCQLLELCGKLYVAAVGCLVVAVAAVALAAVVGYCYCLAGAVTCQVSVFRGFSVSSRSCCKLFCMICKQSAGCQNRHRDSAYDNLSYTAKHLNISSLYAYLINNVQSQLELSWQRRE